MVLNNNRYTKHYYIEGQRICSKLGKGFSAPPVGITQSVTPISGTYTNIANKVLVMFHRGDYKTGFDTLNTTYPASITIVPNSTLPETDRYFYHSDHLGSSSFISSNAGTTTQHLQYLPFGESFVEQNNTTTYLTPYRFSGKERDEETGYSYFGARYYNPELSIWLSVDPMAEKYPSLSPYAYCANNPVMIVDPDGRDWYTNRLTGKQEWHDGSGWRLLVSHNDGGYYQLKTVNVEAMSKKAERRLAEYAVSRWEIEADLKNNNPEYESESTDSRLEAFAGLVSLGALPEFKGLGNLFKNLINSKATKGVTAYETALAGGKHSGFLKNYYGRSADELNKAINTLQTGKRGINTHLDKIANPSKYVSNWNILRPSHQQSLINGWQKEITNGKEQIQILKKLLDN